MRQTDPQAVGEWLLNSRKRLNEGPIWEKHLTFAEIADHIPWEFLPEIDKTFSMGKESALLYQTQLQERAAAGDRFAVAMIEEGCWREPIDD